MVSRWNFPTGAVAGWCHNSGETEVERKMRGWWDEAVFFSSGCPWEADFHKLRAEKNHQAAVCPICWTSRAFMIAFELFVVLDWAWEPFQSLWGVTMLFYIPMAWNKWRQYLNLVTGWTMALMLHVFKRVWEPDGSQAGKTLQSSARSMCRSKWQSTDLQYNLQYNVVLIL